MKMFLTRLGFESKAVITGDVTQIDLPDNRRSGLTEAINLLSASRDRVPLLHRGGRGAAPAGAADHQGYEAAKPTPPAR
jgi:predicted ribonuclease YlaK